MDHNRRVVPLFRHARHEGTKPVSVGNVALADRPAVHGKPHRHDAPDVPEQFPGDPESDTQPIPAIRLSMDWAVDLGEPRDPAVAMDPGVGIEPDLAPVESQPAAGALAQPPPSGPAAGEFADGRSLLRAGLLVILALAVAVALTLALVVAVSGHSGPAGANGQAGNQARQAAPGRVAIQQASACYGCSLWAATTVSGGPPHGGQQLVQQRCRADQRSSTGPLGV